MIIPGVGAGRCGGVIKVGDMAALPALTSLSHHHLPPLLTPAGNLSSNNTLFNVSLSPGRENSVLSTSVNEDSDVAEGILRVECVFLKTKGKPFLILTLCVLIAKFNLIF